MSTTPGASKRLSSKDPPTFHFKQITPEDWRANEAPLADLYQRGIVSAEYVRQRLQIPQEAGTGTMFTPPPAPPPPSTDIKQPEETLKIRTPTGREFTVERKRAS